MKDKTLDVIIETPKGSRHKYKYDTERGIYMLSHVLPAGSVFPYDFGFVPGTKADDGDPLDVLLLMDTSAFAGCLIESRPIGVLVAEQTEEGETERNDRVIAVPQVARAYGDYESLDDLGPGLLQEIEHFFESYNEMQGKEFRVLERLGPEEAWKTIQRARTGKKKKAA